MRLDMIDYCCLRIHWRILLHTQHTQWVRFKVSSTGLLPSTVVTSLAGAVTLSHMKWFVLTTVMFSTRHQLATSAMLTARWWFVWHDYQLLS